MTCSSIRDWSIELILDDSGVDLYVPYRCPHHKEMIQSKVVHKVVQSAPFGRRLRLSLGKS